jgi:uncharacterized protein
MQTYLTPGVYVQEVSTLPPSVPQAQTAIPAFLGYTENPAASGSNLHLVPTRITSMLEFQQYFGGPQRPRITVDAAGKGLNFEPPANLLYYALDLFFKNGGGACYIVSVGTHGTKKKDDFTKGLLALEAEEEPTLIVLSEAVSLGADLYKTLAEEALLHASKFRNRFCILDVPTVTETGKKPSASSAQSFRKLSATANNKLGAAYFPALQTSLTYVFGDADVTITGTDNSSSANTAGTESFAQWSITKTALYNSLKTQLNDPKYRIILPASPAIAGVYAAVDRERGVWKAPANVGLSAVVAPTLKITAEEQESLNVDPDGGKSINAIRTFTGRGVMVWGARTLAGNDNEWRYVPVRRLFSAIEDSVVKASSFAVFEPNDSSTWLKVKSMIESFLYSLWQQGALAGSTSKDSYFVNIGLGNTMTAQDVLEGRMIVEIGVAAVRPAEFIILRFSHKLQEA